MIRLNVERLVGDLGGANEVAATLGLHRTAPYRWLKFNTMSVETLARIKEVWPDLDLNTYFEDMPPWKILHRRKRKAKNERNRRARIRAARMEEKRKLRRQEREALWKSDEPETN